MFRVWQSLAVGGDSGCGDCEEEISDDEEEEDVDLSDDTDQATFDLDSVCGGIVYPMEASAAREAKTRPIVAPLKRLIVVLDLDGMLVHAHMDETCPYDFCLRSGMLIHQRPGTAAFLRWLAQPAIEVAVYTAGLADYAHNVVACLDPESKIVSRVLSRDDCVMSPHGGFLTKDLKKTHTKFKTSRSCR